MMTQLLMQAVFDQSKRLLRIVDPQMSVQLAPLPRNPVIEPTSSGMMTSRYARTYVQLR